MQKAIPILLFASLLAMAIACAQDKNTKIPDVSGTAVSYEWVRYDSLLLKMDTTRIAGSIRRLQSAYPAFWDLYLYRILGVPGENRPAVEDIIGQIIRAESLRALRDSVDRHLGSLDGVQRDFTRAFRYYKYYFPERESPDVYTFLSEFGYAALIFSDEEGADCLGIGLDMFLGPDFPYERLPLYSNAFSAYLTRSFRKEYIVKKGMDALIDDIVPMPEGQKMIDWLVYEGKKMYLLERFLPHAPDSIRWEWSKAQMDWVRENEWNIWSFLIDEDLIYSNKLSDHQKYLRRAPHSAGMPPDAPGRAAVYIGYRIVGSLMEREPIPSIEEMLSMGDGQQVLERAKYKPRR